MRGRWGGWQWGGRVKRGQAHKMPGWDEVTVFMTLFTRATPGTQAS